MQKISSSASFADSKPHYDLLDGLRGVAALLVVWYHVFEGYAFAGGTSIETINHGYLAVARHYRTDSDRRAQESQKRRTEREKEIPQEEHTGRAAVC